MNEDAITTSDLNDRMNLIIASSGLPNSDDTRNKLAPQVISVLIDEQIRLQEAERLELEVGQGEISEGFATIAQQNNMEAAQFQEMITGARLNINSMYDQIRSQLAWGKVVQTAIRPQIIISDSEIDAHLERIKANSGTTEYLTAEIFMPVETSESEGQTRSLAQKIVQEIRGGAASFPQLAQQFSKSAGAAKGGDLGWVTPDQLEDELVPVLPTLAAQDVSDPIRTPSGYHILSVRDQRTITAENLPSREDIRAALGQERLERMARRYLLDLKSEAFIENRLGTQ